MQVLTVAFEVDDRIAYELAGAVKGDVAAALDLEQLDALVAQISGRRQHVRALGGASQCDDRRVLDEQEQILVDRAANPRARRLALERENVGIRLPAEVD